MDLYEQSRTLIYTSPVTRKTRSESGFHEEWDDLVTSLLDNYCGLPFCPYILFLMWFISTSYQRGAATELFVGKTTSHITGRLYTSPKRLKLIF